MSMNSQPDPRLLNNSQAATKLPCSRSVEDTAFQFRENVSTSHVPFFFGYEGARADLESSMRFCSTRTRAGDSDSVRSKPIPWALSSTPQHYLWQPASDLFRDNFISTRIVDNNCKPCGPALQVRSFT